MLWFYDMEALDSPLMDNEHTKERKNSANYTDHHEDEYTKTPIMNIVPEF